MIDHERTSVGGLAKALLSINEFCIVHGISKAFFYKLQTQGNGPRTMKVGKRTLITIEAAAAWRRAMEAA
jgi:predicted DNA-binding transcriptional regulator AlpA